MPDSGSIASTPPGVGAAVGAAGVLMARGASAGCRVRLFIKGLAAVLGIAGIPARFWVACCSGLSSVAAQHRQHRTWSLLIIMFAMTYETGLLGARVRKI
jgi:hypothetical protein